MQYRKSALSPTSILTPPPSIQEQHSTSSNPHLGMLNNQYWNNSFASGRGIQSLPHFLCSRELLLSIYGSIQVWEITRLIRNGETDEDGDDLPLGNDEISLSFDVNTYSISFPILNETGEHFHEGFMGVKFCLELERLGGDSPMPLKCKDMGLQRYHIGDPVLYTLLLIIGREGSVLFPLAGHQSTILRYILTYRDPTSKIINDETISSLKISKITKWPEHKDLKCNMLPFEIGNLESIPDEYKNYWDIISNCNKGWENEYKQRLRKIARQKLEPSNKDIVVPKKKIGYLTIHECYVEPSKSQRRSGLHTETPGTLIGDCIRPRVNLDYHHWG